MLGHSKADDLLAALNKNEGAIPFNNVAQLSMDGPNVNWALFDKFQKQIMCDHRVKLWNVGSCGLHQIHNAFRKGMEATEWDLEHILRSVHYLFTDVLA